MADEQEMVDPDVLYRSLHRRVPITSGRAGYGRRFKTCSGEVRRDFLAAYEGTCAPEERLASMLRHASYEPSHEEREAAVAFLTRPEHRRAGNVYTLTHAMERDWRLARLAAAIRDGFAFKDKYAEDWRLIYGLVGRAGAATVAEFGVTERPLEEVVARLSTPGGRRRTRLAAFMRAAEDVYAVPFESAFGDLDHADGVKNDWRRAALRAGVALAMPLASVAVGCGARRTPPCSREWPGTEWLVAVGVPVGPVRGDQAHAG